MFPAALISPLVKIFAPVMLPVVLILPEVSVLSQIKAHAMLRLHKKKCSVLEVCLG
jgi:hypothetical protein